MSDPQRLTSTSLTGKLRREITFELASKPLKTRKV
jgi:hypothetical protein